jgi:23S rRNA pseudouridine2604 synthase
VFLLYTPRVETPLYLTKRMADEALCSRREADALIKAGRVFVDGKVATVGQKVTQKQKIEIKGALTPRVYIAYHKERGIVTHSPTHGEKDILMVAPFRRTHKDVFPLGRLDKDSHGLILLTNDRRVTGRLLNPESMHEKEYVVTVARPLRAGFAKAMEKGVTIGSYKTLPCKVAMRSDKEFSVVLTEGKNHQIRRMVSALHNDVLDLIRVRIMNIRLGSMAPNSFRFIEGKELEVFLHSLGL